MELVFSSTFLFIKIQNTFIGGFHVIKTKKESQCQTSNKCVPSPAKFEDNMTYSDSLMQWTELTVYTGICLARVKKNMTG